MLRKVCGGNRAGLSFIDPWLKLLCKNAGKVDSVDLVSSTFTLS